MMRDFAIALQILLAASAFGVTWPDKPAAADAVRNIFAPRPDYLAVGWMLNEGSGTTANNLGKRASYNGTLAAATWITDTWGAAPGNVIIRGPDAAGTLFYPRGTFLAFVSPGGPGVRQAVAIEGQSTAVANSFVISISSANDELVFTLSDATPTAHTLRVDTLETAAYDLQSIDTVPVVATFGELGMHLYTPYGYATDSYTGGIIITTGNNIIVNGTSTGTEGTAYSGCFAWWDYQLTEREARELLADPFLWGRPPLSDGLNKESVQYVSHIANPIVGRPTASSLTWQVGVPTAADVDPAVLWRVVYKKLGAATASALADTATSTLTLSDASTTGWTTIDSDDVGLPSTITATGLDAGSIYVWRAEYKHPTTRQAFPGGIGYATTQRASGAYNAIVLADCHLGYAHFQTGFVYNIRRGIDVTTTGLGSTTMQHGWVSAREQAEYCFANGCDFQIDVGDSHFGIDAVSWPAVMNDAFKTGAYFQVPGNHENMRGDVLEVAGGNLLDERTVYGIVANRRNVCNPTGSTYPEGGESEGCPNDPYSGSGAAPYCSAVSWVPSAASCEGDWVTLDAAGDNWDTKTEAQTTSEYLQFNTSGVTWEDKLGPLWQACTNGLGNYYGFTWGEATFWILDNYLYSAVGSDRHDDIRLDPEDWTYGPQQTWLEAGMAASTKPWQFVFQHMNAGGVQTDDNGSDDDWYGRGSGVTNSSTSERWLKDVMRQYGAVEFKGHDHGLADTEDGGLQIITAGVYSSNFRFLTDANDPWGAWDFGMDYGDPTTEGHNEPHIRHISGDWGFGILTVTDADTATYSYYRSSVNHLTLTDQTSSDTRPFQHGGVGEVLTVGASGNVTLAGTPNDVLVVCEADDGDLLQYGASTVIADNSPAWGGANEYDATLQDWGTNGAGKATIDLGAMDEPHADAVIATNLAEGTRVRVHWAPRVTYTTTLHRAVSNPTYVPLDGTVRGSAGLHYRGD